MDFNPHGLRRIPRALRAHNKLDTVARHFATSAVPTGRSGKFWKDDQSCKSLLDYLEEKYLDARITKRKGRYQPAQIARNFFR